MPWRSPLRVSTWWTLFSCRHNRHNRYHPYDSRNTVVIWVSTIPRETPCKGNITRNCHSFYLVLFFFDASDKMFPSQFSSRSFLLYRLRVPRGLPPLTPALTRSSPHSLSPSHTTDSFLFLVKTIIGSSRNFSRKKNFTLHQLVLSDVLVSFSLEIRQGYFQIFS